MGGVHCVLAAAQSAIIAHLRATLRTRSLSTEVLFNLAPHSKIAVALQQFGVKDEDTNFLAVTVDWLEGGETGPRDQEAQIPTPAADQVAIVDCCVTMKLPDTNSSCLILTAAAY